MIYSTLAAAFPYAHKSNSKSEHPEQPMNQPTPIETGNMLDLSRQNTEIKRELAD